MEKQKRTEFTPEQVRMLEEAYGQGTRKGKAWLGAHQELAAKLNLTELQVKNWLGNYHKSKSGHGKLVQRKTLPAVRPTAYSLFCKEYSKDHPGFNPSIWKMEWEAAGEKEKERYAKMAREMSEEGGSVSTNDDPTTQKKTIRTLLKQLEWTSRRLENMGLPNFALVAENNTVHSVGTGRGREFLDREDIEPNFSRFCNQDYSTPEKSKVNELRKTVQVHMNELYRKASGKAGCFPYKMVRKGDIVVEGLPQAVLPLHPPSHYGEEKLQLLLSCPSISVNYPQSAEEPTDSLSQEPFIEHSSSASSNEPSTSSTRPSSLEPLPTSSSQHATTEMEDVGNDLIGILGVTSELGTDVSVEERNLVSSAVFVEPNEKKIKKEMRKMTKQKGKSKGKESKAKQKKMAFDDNEPGFYYVDEILSERKKNGKSEFLIKWEGYEDPTWEPERNIPTHLIEEFKNV
ncbi:uncharacterized protein LOC133176084 [Saccostrea echinata]|uniref:uncharacterized protein LOC133176084 n=1 Tax=Saccostrea echinata TaxID=191078 RepID=UPI002A81D2D7|nr:uncharacterized protein LOC133176084 [Saccostrea echinata]